MRNLAAGLLMNSGQLQISGTNKLSDLQNIVNSKMQAH